MVGLINLFVYILKYPTLLSAQGDVAALDVAVGHFGHLEVLTSSELSFPFAREVARIAYTTVKSCGGRESLGLTRPATPGEGEQQGLPPPPSFLPIGTDTDNNVTFSTDVNVCLLRFTSRLLTPISFQAHNGFDITALDLENFDVFGDDILPSEGDMIYFPP